MAACRAGGEHLTEDHLVDVARGDRGALERRLDGGGTELIGRNAGERAGETSDGRACRADDDDVVGHSSLPPNRVPERALAAIDHRRSEIESIRWHATDPVPPMGERTVDPE
jgi:hypothetical protein